MINELSAKKATSAELRPAPRLTRRGQTPNFCGIAFGAGTGGALGVRKIFSGMNSLPHAAFFIVLHGPGWAAEALAEQLQAQFASAVVIPKDNEKVKPGTIYIAPGDRHMIITPDALTIGLAHTPPENFHRPSIDPLFRSLAEVFGRRGVGVVLAGTGIDGYIGAGHIQVAHGTVIVQEPTDTAASQMTQNVITLGLATRVLPLEKIGGELLENLRTFHDSRVQISLAHHSGNDR
jgi:two-component system chemotaxis response regulator CheB